MSKRNPPKKKSPSMNEIRIMVAAAQLCYQQEMTQEEVGKLLGISRPKVSRLLSQARENGIVEIIVRNPITHNIQVQSDLIKAYNLRDAVVTPHIIDKPDVIVPRIASAAAKYIMDNLPDRSILAVGRGHAIYETASCFSASKYQRPTVIPLSGAIGEYDSVYPLDESLHVIASAFGGQVKFIYAPALLDNERYRSAVLAEPQSREVVDLWDQIDWAIMGIGIIRRTKGPNPYYERAIDTIIREFNVGPVGEVNLSFILPDGQMPISSYNKCLVAASPEQIKRAKVRLAVAGGLYKLPAIHVALLSGIINVLVTDENTATELIKLKAGNKSQ